MLRLLAIILSLLQVPAFAASAPKIDALERYVGYYQADPKTYPDTVVDVGRNGDRLAAQFPGQPRSSLTPTNERQFSFYQADAQNTVTLTFQPANDGRVEKLILRRNDIDIPMTRINVKAALELIDRAMLNAWFSSSPGLTPAPSPGTPALPSWTLLPRTAASIPLATATMENAPATATIPLAKHGYVEEEYTVSGRGHIYTLDGKRIWRADMPYTTRILVRRPADPKAFSGTIHMEPFADQSETTPTTMDVWPYFVRHGDVFVAWTMTKANVPDLLQKFDRTRYAALNIPANGLRWDMMTQIAWLLRSPDGPLGKQGLIAAGAQKNGGVRVYSTGAGPAAEMQALYLNIGFHARARTPQGDPVIDGYVPVMNIQRIVPQDDAFVMRVMTESEFANPGTYDQPGAWVTRPAFRGQTVNLREYHIAGTSHIDAHNQPQLSMAAYQLGLTDAPKCTHPIVAETPGRAHVVRALYAALDQWVRENKNPPNTRLFLLDPEHMPVRDPQNGNIVGALRPSWINVPTTRFAIDNSAAAPTSPLSAATCKFYGYHVPFPKTRLAELYRDRADYLDRVSQHLDRMVQQRYLLPEEAEEERKSAEKKSLPLGPLPGVTTSPLARSAPRRY
jgi:hypothetical protein